jgi:hypothetical protein
MTDWAMALTVFIFGFYGVFAKLAINIVDTCQHMGYPDVPGHGLP